MTTPNELRTAVLTRLTGASSLTVFDGDVSRERRFPRVPDGQTWALPANDKGIVYPYVVQWPGAGAPAPEADIAAEPRGELAWETRITVASGDVDWTLGAAALVRARLHLAEVLPGVRLREEPVGVPVSKTPDVSPTRWFVPLMFRALTP